jgi:hypothetical protein
VPRRGPGGAGDEAAVLAPVPLRLRPAVAGHPARLPLLQDARAAAAHDVLVLEERERKDSLLNNPTMFHREPSPLHFDRLNALA